MDVLNLTHSVNLRLGLTFAFTQAQALSWQNLWLRYDLVTISTVNAILSCNSGSCTRSQFKVNDSLQGKPMEVPIFEVLKSNIMQKYLHHILFRRPATNQKLSRLIWTKHKNLLFVQVTTIREHLKSVFPNVKSKAIESMVERDFQY